MKGYMAGLEKCLERHEWVKHGVCSPMAAQAYFEWSLAKAKEISEAVAPYVDRKLSRKAFNKLIADKLPELDGAVRLKCAGSNLYSMSVFYKWGDSPQEVIPTTSRQNSFGNCKKTFRNLLSKKMEISYGILEQLDLVHGSTGSPRTI